MPKAKLPPAPEAPPKKRRGRPKRRFDGREVFKTRLHPDVIEELRVIGQGWANRGIELLVRRFGPQAREIHHE